MNAGIAAAQVEPVEPELLRVLNALRQEGDNLSLVKNKFSGRINNLMGDSDGNGDKPSPKDPSNSLLGALWVAIGDIRETRAELEILEDRLRQVV